MNLTEIPKVKRGFILVKKLRKPSIDQTKAGILMPADNRLNLYEKAEVLSVGGDLEDYKMETKVGDTIIILASHVQLSDRTLRVNGQPLFIVREESAFFGWI